MGDQEPLMVPRPNVRGPELRDISAACHWPVLEACVANQQHINKDKPYFNQEKKGPPMFSSRPTRGYYVS